MIEFLKEWITNIIVAIIFGAFVDILISNSSMKKYVKLILGLLIMTVILQPVLKLINGDFSLSTASFHFQNKLDSIYLKKQVEYYNQEQSDQITKAYKENLEKQMEQQIKAEIKSGEVKVRVDVIEDTASKDYGKLKKINVTIIKNADGVTKVEKVKIGKVKGDEKDNEVASGEYTKVKNMLSSIYGIGVDFIEINVSNKR